MPIFIRSILSSGIWSLDFKDNMSRIPWIAASEYCLGFSDSSLCVEILPSGLRPIISVKVPPLSIQNCHLLWVFVNFLIIIYIVYINDI